MTRVERWGSEPQAQQLHLCDGEDSIWSKSRRAMRRETQRMRDPDWEAHH